MNSLKGIAKGIFEKIRGQKYMGVDSRGNKYYELFETSLHHEGNPPKRIVKYSSSLPDPSSIPIIWYQWINHRRALAPSPEEYEAWEAEQKERREMVQRVDQRLEEERMREKTLRDLEAKEGLKYQKRTASERLLGMDAKSDSKK